MIEPIETKLAGVTFDDCQANIRKWGCRDIGYFRLEREPDHPQDPNAVSVWFLNDRLGYLPTPVAKRIAPVMDGGAKLTARFVCRNQFAPDSIVGLTVKIIEDGPVG